jgi:23S rRNA (uracil1939-C5)-methyltransferase
MPKGNELFRAAVVTEVKVSPRCRHFPDCGGCSWQDIDYLRQLELKEEEVRRLFRALNLSFLDFPSINGMEDPWFYRNKMEFTFRAGAVLGLHRRGNFREVVELEECFLPSPIVNAILQTVKNFVRENNLSLYSPRTRSGLLRYLVIREGKNTGEILVNIVTFTDNFPEIELLSSILLRELPAIKTFFWSIGPYPADAVKISEMRLIAGQPFITEKLGNFTFRIRPNSFFQTNTQQAEKLCYLIREMASLKGGERVLDLYCGVGTFSFFLADRALKVYGIEIDPQTVEEAQENAYLNGIGNVEFISGDVRKVVTPLWQRMGGAEVMILDPPRAGIPNKVLDKLLSYPSPTVIYVSCNPRALGENLPVFLAHRYRVETIRLIDMFPHTPHVETVILLKKV